MSIIEVQKRILKPALVLFGIIAFSAVPIDIAVSIDTNTGYVGDIFHYKVRLRAERLSDIVLPQPDIIPGPFAVLGYRSLTNAAKNTIMVTYKLSVYDIGNFTIPPLTARAADGTAATSLPVTISIVPISTNAPELPDIRGEVSIPFPLWFWGALLLIVGLIVLAVFVIQRLPKKTSAKPVLPEDEEALQAIHALMARDYFTAGKHKEFYFELSEIMRQYLARRFDIPAVGSTTAELDDMMHKGNMPHADHFSDFLAYADMIKFAKAIPSSVENGRYSDFCIEYVRSTRKVQDR